GVIYRFGECELDLGRYRLRRDGEEQRVEPQGFDGLALLGPGGGRVGPGGGRGVGPQVFDVLALLVRERERVVRREELLDAVWGDRFVSESAVTSRIKAARQAIGDAGKPQGLIRTVHGRGYQFVGAVDEVVDE